MKKSFITLEPVVASRKSNDYRNNSRIPKCLNVIKTQVTIKLKYFIIHGAGKLPVVDAMRGPRGL